MRVLALTRLLPSRYEPTNSTYNQGHFASLGTIVELDLVVPVVWYRKRLRCLMPDREVFQLGSRSFPTLWYPPRIALDRHWWYYMQSIRGTLAKLPRPEIIYATCCYPDGFAGVALGRQLGLPVVVKGLGSDIHSVAEAVKKPTAETLSAASGLITVSAELARLAIEQGANPDSTRTIYNGIDQQQFSPMPRAEACRLLGLSGEKKRVLCVARLHPVKALDRLIAAFSAIRDSEFELYILGDGPIAESLASLAASSPASERIHFMGNVAYRNIPIWMNACEVTALSSLNEGVPNVLVESLSCGTPVVAADVGGTSEIVHDGDHGRLVPSGDIQAMTNALLEVTAQSWQREDLRASVSELTWDENARQTRDFLTTVAQRHCA